MTKAPIAGGLVAAGIDFNTYHADVVVLASTGWRHHRFVFDRQGDAFDRARSVRLVMPSAGFWAGVAVIAIEQPAGKYQLVNLARVQGAILQTIPTSRLVAPVVPGEWKKATVGDGSAIKQDVIDWVEQQTGVRLDEHAADAYGIASWALAKTL